MRTDILLQIILLIGSIFLIPLGAFITFSKKYYMKITEGYLGDDYENEYYKLSLYHRLYRRYRWGAGGLVTGIIFLAFFIWITFIR